MRMVGLMVFDRRQQVGARRMVVREMQLVFGQLRAALDDEALGIDKPDAFARFGQRKTFLHQHGDDVVGDAHAGLARAEEQHALVAHLAAGQAQRREDARQRDGAGALDVVVEGAELVAIAFQQAEGVAVAEIFKLEERVREHLFDGRDEFLDERVIGFAAQAFLAQADVERIVEEGFVVGAHVNA